MQYRQLMWTFLTLGLRALGLLLLTLALIPFLASPAVQLKLASISAELLEDIRAYERRYYDYFGRD